MVVLSTLAFMTILPGKILFIRNIMSALPVKADIQRGSRNVR